MQNNNHLLKLIDNISHKQGLLWEKIHTLKNQLSSLPGAATHKCGEPQEELMKKHFPLKHHFEGGLYTREIFMPKGSLNISLIHKQQHPSFLVKGKLSYLNDEGVVETIEAPHSIFTQIGTQRVFYIHEDVIWICVYKTDATTPEEAEREIYTENYTELPPQLITKKIEELCQD